MTDFQAPQPGAKTGCDCGETFPGGPKCDGSCASRYTGAIDSSILLKAEVIPWTAIREVIRISDRSHPAWDEVKDWLEMDGEATAAPAARRQAEPVAVLETPDGVINLRAIAEQAGISMDCWDMGAASCAYSAGCRGITRAHLEKFAALYGFACWNAALEANPPNLNGFVSRALAEAMKGSA